MTTTKKSTPQAKKKRTMWTTAAMLTLTSTHGSRLLTVMVMPVPGLLEWQMVAVETKKPTPTTREGMTEAIGDALGDFFDDHGHKDLGSTRDVRDAIEIAERYAHDWQRERERVEPCPCEEIDS